MSKNPALVKEVPSSVQIHLLRRRKRHQRNKNRLQLLIQEIVTDYGNLPRKGLRFVVDELETIGRPLQRIDLWATLHFLPLGSPFCCSEPCCRLPVIGRRLLDINEAMRRHLQSRQEITVDFKGIAAHIHPEVLFDDCNGKSPTLDYYDIDARDALGRTALMRAALRGHNHIVESLVEAGADPTIRDKEGRTAIEQVRGRRMSIARMLQY